MGGGGVLEHPEGSHAWKYFGLIAPLRGGGWSQAEDGQGWTCCVEQGAYGHRAKKATWLYAVRCDLPVLRWSSTSEHPGTARNVKNGALERLSKRQRAATPPEFRDILIAMARSVR